MNGINHTTKQHRRQTEKAARSVQFEPVLNAVNTPVNIVHALVQDGVIGMNVGNIAAQASQAALDRTHAHGERVDRALHVADIGANRPQVLNDDVFDVFSHGAIVLKPAADSRTHATPMQCRVLQANS